MFRKKAETKLIKKCGEEYMICKPNKYGEFNQIGRKYTRQGLLNYLVNEHKKEKYILDESLSEDDVNFIMFWRDWHGKSRI